MEFLALKFLRFHSNRLTLKTIPVPNLQFESRYLCPFFRIILNQITVHSYVFIVKSRISQNASNEKKFNSFSDAVNAIFFRITRIFFFKKKIAACSPRKASCI